MSRLTCFALVCLAGLVSASCSGPDPAAIKAEAVKRGEAMLAEGRFAEAVRALNEAVGVDPRDGLVRLKLAEAYRGRREWADAAREAILAADLMPDNKDAQLQAIVGMAGMSRFEDVLARTESLLKADPQNPKLLMLWAMGRSRVLAATHGLFEFGEAWRLGRSVEGARMLVRQPPSRAEDREAEVRYRQACALDAASSEPCLALVGFLWITDRMDEGADLLKRAADADPSHAFLSRALALYYESRGRLREAEAYLGAAAATGDQDSALALADFLVRRGRDTEALAGLEKVTAGGGGSTVAVLHAGDIELRLGRHEAALARAESILKGDPSHPEALVLRAQALLASGNTAAAVVAARDAASRRPAAREPRLVLGRALSASGDVDGAFNELADAWRTDMRDGVLANELATLALALGRDDVALDFARQAARLTPDAPAAAVTLARAQVRAGDFAGAERTMAGAAGKLATSAELQLLRGAIQAGRGQHDAARATFRGLLATAPDTLDALAGLVEVEIAARQPARVRSMVDAAAARHPKDARYQMLGARVAQAAGDLPRATTLGRAVLDLDAGHVGGALLLADVLTRQNQREEALGVVEQVLARRPTSLDLAMTEARLLEDLGRSRDARSRYEAIVATHKEAYVASYRLAALYANDGERLDDALQLASTARRFLPDDPAVSDTLGWVYVRRNLARAGLPHLLAAVKTEPNRALFRFHLGVAYERQGEFLKAADELARALALDPAFPGAAEARTLLKSLGR